MAQKTLVEQIVHNYYGQIEILKARGKQPTMTLREYLEGIMLTSSAYTKHDFNYGLKYGEQLAKQKGIT